MKHRRCSFTGVMMVLGFGAWCFLAAFRASARSEAYDPLTMDFPVSPSQAMAAVRDLVGDPGLDLHLMDVDRSEPYPGRAIYRFEGANGDSFYVDAEDGWVRTWYNDAARGRLVDHRRELDPSTQLSPQTLLPMAEAFAAAHYPDFAALNMQRPFPELYHWVMRLPSGAWNPGICSIGINPWTGEVWYIIRRRPLPVTISTTPAISSAQAEDSALAWLLEQPDTQTAFLLENTGYFWVYHDHLGGQRVLYQITFVTHEDPDYTPAMYLQELQGDAPISASVVVAQVDAHTGEALAAYDILPLGKDDGAARPPANVRAGHRKTPSPAGKPTPEPLLLMEEGEASGSMYSPLLLDGKAYLYVRYLATLRDGDVKWRDGQVVLRMRGREYRLRPGSAEVSCGDEVLRLSGVVRNLRGRVYVPVDAFPKLAGLKADYDAKSRTVRLATGRKRLAAAPAAE